MCNTQNFFVIEPTQRGWRTSKSGTWRSGKGSLDLTSDCREQRACLKAWVHRERRESKPISKSKFISKTSRFYSSHFSTKIPQVPIPVAARSKAWICDRSPAETVGSNPGGGHGCLSVVSVVFCQVEVSATRWSLVQRSPTECCVSVIAKLH